MDCLLFFVDLQIDVFLCLFNCIQIMIDTCAKCIKKYYKKDDIRLKVLYPTMALDVTQLQWLRTSGEL